MREGIFLISSGGYTICSAGNRNKVTQGDKTPWPPAGSAGDIWMVCRDGGAGGQRAEPRTTLVPVPGGTGGEGEGKGIVGGGCPWSCAWEQRPCPPAASQAVTASEDPDAPSRAGRQVAGGLGDPGFQSRRTLTRALPAHMALVTRCPGASSASAVWGIPEFGGVLPGSGQLPTGVPTH